MVVRKIKIIHTFCKDPCVKEIQSAKCPKLYQTVARFYSRSRVVKTNLVYFYSTWKISAHILEEDAGTHKLTARISDVCKISDSPFLCYVNTTWNQKATTRCFQSCSRKPGKIVCINFLFFHGFPENLIENWIVALIHVWLLSPFPGCERKFH